MNESPRPLSERLERPTGWALAGGVIAAFVGLMIGSLPLTAGAFLISFLARAVPAEIGLRECRRDGEAEPARGSTPEQITACLEGEGIGLGTADRRFQELVSGQRADPGRVIQ